MKSLCVIQHTSADYLGLIEDHLEGRRIRFHYTRPFTEDGVVPAMSAMQDGLVLLGGGPWGTAGTRDVPTLKEEISLARAYLMHDKPVIGIGLGAQILALAADGKTQTTDYSFKMGHATRCADGALNGFLPEQYPNAVFMRDKPVPPTYAKVLAIDETGDPALFQIGENTFGFAGHPGFKLAMAEDLIMEFDETPSDTAEPLATLRQSKHEIEDALVPTMTGLVQLTGLMRE
ncbi:MAG: glutamine amidotransferase-related protein [Rhizobiaceae bacterium]